MGSLGARKEGREIPSLDRRREDRYTRSLVRSGTGTQPMETRLAGLAEIALKAQTAMARRDLSIAMVKQNLQMDQAVVQMLTHAADQATQAAAVARPAASGHIVDILV